MASDYEKLGSFYLGKEYDTASRARLDNLVLYDSRDLVTHAVCVGMTGSGKTGLCIGLLEEAAIDGVPAIIIDPKGDLSNLLLTFPDLRPEDFRPWINEDDARRKGVAPDDFARQQAELWRKGLESWGQSGERIRRLRESAEFAVYTPGSSAGLPVSILRSFDAPPAEIVEDAEVFRERVSGTASSLLALAGVTADPVQSREHILISTILGHAWAAGRGLDLPALIHAVQKPPMPRIGVMDLETFYPEKDRFALAMALNNLVASPGFSRWTEGEPLDIRSALFSPAGKPRLAIYSIAHLSDAERMFFVSLLLNQVLAWVRTQSGTTSLRAILYMDEIAGYVPPIANPPSKPPLLTLMKQGRAFGLGVVLATQNPVDLDYKGLSNAGTWFIGRLQTERDKARVLDGLEGAMAAASARFDRQTIDQTLSSLGQRVFLMNNIHDDAPVVFETRWVMSYLRGPLTRQQIKQLTAAGAAPQPEPTRQPPQVTTPPAATPPAPAAPERAAPQPRVAPPAGAPRPVLPPEIPQYFVPARAGAPTYTPRLLGLARISYRDARLGVEADVPVARLASIEAGPVVVDWDHASECDLSEKDVEHEPAAGASFDPLPPQAGKPRSYDEWKKALAQSLFRTHKLELRRSPTLGLVSRPGEDDRDFLARLVQRAREDRDQAVEKLRAKYAPRLATLQERIRKAQQQLEVQKDQARGAKVQSAIGFGAAILGAVLGRKAGGVGTVGRTATAMRGATRAGKESSDVDRAEANVQAAQEQFAALDREFQAELDALGERFDPLREALEPITLTPKKTGITVRAVVLAWTPKESQG